MRKIKNNLALVALMGILTLGSCAGIGPVLLGEAIDDMVVDVIPGDAEPELNFPFVGDLHEIDWSWYFLMPWTWFSSEDEAASESEQ